MASPLLLLLVLVLIIFLRYVFVYRLEQKLDAHKVYCLTRKDVGYVVSYGLILGILIGFVGRLIGQIVTTNNDYLLVVLYAFVYFVMEIIHKRVVVPFLNRRETR